MRIKVLLLRKKKKKKDIGRNHGRSIVERLVRRRRVAVRNDPNTYTPAANRQGGWTGKKKYNT